ncbi:methylmalonyl Co-A mutase-associated GTPase MeaB [soil metagenome]
MPSSASTLANKQTMSLDQLVSQALSGNQRALSRVATIIESESAQALAVRQLLRGKGGRARIIGITGPPGAGKSSILASIAARISLSGKSVAIIAVDPTSPISGGATLGDRIRMSEVSLRPNVFVRSLASRSRIDGLAPAALAIIRLFDAAGFDYVFLETVGAGQNQFEIANYVHTLVLVEAPGAGDSVQMLKAGIMELADIYAVNKADMPGAHLVSRELRAMLTLGDNVSGDWQPPIVLCSSETGEGFDALIQAIDDHGAHLRKSGSIQERSVRMARTETVNAVQKLVERFLDRDQGLIAAVADGTHTPEQAAGKLLSRVNQMPRAET